MTRPRPPAAPSSERLSLRLRPARLRPTKLGLGFLVLILLTLIGCVNYSLSLGYGATFLLAGVWVVTAAQAVRAGRTLRLRLDTPGELVAGVPLTLSAQISGLPGTPFDLRVPGLAHTQGQLGTAPGTDTAATAVTLTLPPRPRGPLALPPLHWSALDPLGLWHYRREALPEALGLKVQPLVWPQSEAQAPAAPLHLLGTAEDGLHRIQGDEDFAGLRPYRDGDSPRRVSWRHAARSGQLMTRELDAPAGAVLSLDWDATAVLGPQQTEARLSRLSAWVDEARQQRQAFALTLPGVHLPPATGELQVRAALNALALHPPLPAGVNPAGAEAAARGQRTPPVAEVLPTGPLRLTLWSLALALLPGVLRQPLWVTALIVLLLGLSAARISATPAAGPPAAEILPRWRRPIPSAALGLIAGVAGVALNSSYGTLLGAQAGTALLGVLLALKVAESRTRRDMRLLMLLGLFLTFTQFLHSQGPLVALHALLSLTVLLAVGTVWVVAPAGKTQTAHTPATGTQEAAPPHSSAPLRRAAGLVGLALPLAAVLFVLFPRPDGPLWRLPTPQGAQTGLADQISAGEFSGLARNDAVAFRADFSQGMPAPQDRYWRGPVFEAYDGLTWNQVRGGSGAPTIEFSGPESVYTLTLEPNSKPWLLTLDVPTTLPQGTFLSSAFQAVNPRPSANRTRYAIRSRSARLGVQENQERLSFNLLLPGNQSPRAVALGTGWRSLAPAQRVQAGLDFLRSGGFSYTLSPPLLPEQHRVDAFLFGSRAGFCEHYASAFAVLMRAAGLPTRIVGGYLGGELNPDGGYLIVRQQDAHAWTEVWLEGQGWVRVDPTAVVAPARQITDLRTALTRPNASQALPLTALGQARLRLDALQNRWNEWVVGYDGTQQRTLLTRAGLGGVGTPAYALTLLGLLVLAAVPVLWWQRRAARPRDPLQAALYDLTLRLRLPRQPGETPSAYAARASAQYPQQAEALRAFVDAYQQARYGAEGGTTEHVRRTLKKIRR